ncbi:FkbM family methyltransferase [Fulvivirgaceae bacterium BMA10]|uniref:FkbM family methyltransferase n=1 Tax=Splendidivirga corallicola TaxID=3051826 RepID=A0ABT8KR26_9BACT|nr:FkbM family methyltransferase [Fulvivirgaceae bacterium BMA10]
MENFRKKLGLIRSIFIYYLKPFNGIRLRRLYSHFIQKGDLCFDLGAHLGNRSNAWLKLGANVVAVEPQPICIDYLQKKFRNKKDFILVEKAVGATKGKSILKVSKLYPTISTLSEEWQFSYDKPADTLDYWDEEIDVDVTTLDTLIDEYGIPKFCKIDVEDFEWEVLRGLSHKIPALSFEFFPAKTQNAILCLNKLKELGEYEFNVSYEENLTFVYKKWLDYQSIITFMKCYDKEISGDIYARIRQNN